MWSVCPNFTFGTDGAHSLSVLASPFDSIGGGVI